MFMATRFSNMHCSQAWRPLKMSAVQRHDVFVSAQAWDIKSEILRRMNYVKLSHTVMVVFTVEQSWVHEVRYGPSGICRSCAIVKFWVPRVILKANADSFHSFRYIWGREGIEAKKRDKRYNPKTSCQSNSKQMLLYASYWSVLTLADERQSRDDKANCAKHDLISRNFELIWCERSE